MLERNLYQDELTKVNSFIKFLDQDFGYLFGNQGYFILIKVENLHTFKHQFSAVEADVVLLRLAIMFKRLIHPQNIFRMENGDFLLVFKGIDDHSVGILAKRMQQHFNEIANDYAGSNLKLLVRKVAYKEGIDSVQAFYQYVLEDDNTPQEVKDQDKRIEELVIGMTNRLKESVSYYHDIYQFAIFDDVSKLPNSKAAKDYLSRLRTDHPLALAFIDGDDLSRFNAISYEMGNEVIAHLGEAIKSTLRVDDRVFRWLSGDEFIVVMHNVTKDQAFLLCERIRQHIQDDPSYSMTVSIGLVHSPSHGQDVDTLVHYAELANRQAKNKGKNATALYNDHQEGIIQSEIV